MDPKEQLRVYIKDTRASGFKDDDIRMHLKAIGWTDKDIDAAMESPPEAQPPSPPAREAAPAAGAPAQAGGGAVAVHSEEESFQSPSRFRTSLVALLVIAGVFLIGGTAYGGYIYWDSRPERVLRQMKENQKEILSFSYDAQFIGDMEFHPILDSTIGGGMRGEGAPMSTEPQKTLTESIEGNLTGTTSHSRDNKHVEAQTEASLALTYEGVSMNAALETRVLDDTAYVRLREVPFLFLMLPDLKDQWIRFSKEDIEKLRQDPQFAPFFQGYTPYEKDKKTDEKNRRIAELWDGLEWRNFKERLRDETLDGVKVYHYVMLVDKKAIQDALIDTMRITREGEQYGDLITEDEIKKFEEEFEKAFRDDVRFQDLHYYIGKRDRLPYRIKGGAALEDSDVGKFDFTLTVDYRDYNQPLAVRIPENARGFAEFVTEMIDKMSSGAIEPPLPPEKTSFRKDPMPV